MSGLIVGIGYVKRVGKDTAAMALCRDLGFRRVGFADKLKELALEADPLVTSSWRGIAQNVNVGHGRLRHLVRSLGWEQAKDAYPEIRSFLENLGEGARKVFGDDFWIERALSVLNPNDRVVVADMRHPNEADIIRSLGGKVIRIDRPGHEPGGHISNRALVDYEFDAVITNDRSLLELEQDVVEVVRTWLAPKPPASLDMLPDPDLEAVLDEEDEAA